MTVFTNISSVKGAEPIFLYATLLMEAQLFHQLNRERLISGQFALCLAAFMPGPSNMRPATGVSSHKYPCCFDKVVSSELNIK